MGPQGRGRANTAQRARSRDFERGNGFFREDLLGSMLVNVHGW
jgi:hypothetical protein